MTHSVTIGVIGVGYLGRHHARILKSLSGADLVGIHDANPDRLKEIAAEVGTTGYARIICGRRPVGAIVLDRSLRYLRTEFWW